MGLLGNVGKALFGGSKSWNTYTAPNIDFLRESAPTVNYDFLREREPANTYDFLRAPRTGSMNRFQGWLGNINAPSSVDAVRGELNNTRLNSTVDDIYRDTREKFGNELMASFGRGIFDPSTGADSDIARLGLAKVASEGARTAADARTTLGLGEIERLAGRESAARDAYGQMYGTESAADLSREGAYAQGITGMADRRLSRDTAYAQGITGNADREMQRRKALAGALLGIASGQSAGQHREPSPGLVGTFFDSYAKSAGQSAGSGGGGLSKYLTGIF